MQEKQEALGGAKRMGFDVEGMLQSQTGPLRAGIVCGES
jgi:hypothetical protein